MEGDKFSRLPPFNVSVESVSNGFVVRANLFGTDRREFVVQAEGSGADAIEPVIRLLRQLYEKAIEAARPYEPRPSPAMGGR